MSDSFFGPGKEKLANIPSQDQAEGSCLSCTCDRSEDPGCCLRFFCGCCTMCAYEGASPLAIVTMICQLLSVFVVPGVVALVFSFVWQPPLFGKHYGPNTV